MDRDKGLIYAYILDGKGSGSGLTWNDVDKWKPEDGVLWVHLDYRNEYACSWLKDKGGLSEIVREALMEVETRPRYFSSENGFLLLLRGVNFNPGSDPEDMVSVRIWADKNRIISMRHRHVKAIEDIHKAIEASRGPVSATEFFTTVIERITDRMGEIISDIDDNVDELEDSVLIKESDELRSQLAKVRRMIISLRRYIAPQRDMLVRLCHERIADMSDSNIAEIRESAERTSRYVEDLDAARDRAAITQEELNSRLAERMNKTMYVLSLVAAIFLPLGLLTGLLGINVGGIPGAEWGAAFLVVCVLLIAIASLQLWLFKWKKWF
ncbi:MAG: zinc transporter ZntB [Nitrospirota bacterium]|nr:MAG: zinc transporter ZntB [Nitrospirota bacterium]